MVLIFIIILSFPGQLSNLHKAIPGCFVKDKSSVQHQLQGVFDFFFADLSRLKILNVKNPRLKSRASDKKQKPLFVGLRFALICFLLHLPDALPSGFSLTQALCQDPYPGSPTAVQALKVDFHHGSHASPRYRCFVIWLFPFQECLFTCDRFYPLMD